MYVYVHICWRITCIHTCTCIPLITFTTHSQIFSTTWIYIYIYIYILSHTYINTYYILHMNIHIYIFIYESNFFTRTSCILCPSLSTSHGCSRPSQAFHVSWEWHELSFLIHACFIFLLNNMTFVLETRHILDPQSRHTGAATYANTHTHGSGSIC